MKKSLLGVFILTLSSFSLGTAQRKSVKFTSPDQFQRTTVNGGNEFSVKQKPQNVFSYATKNKNPKQFSFRERLNLLQSELETVNNKDNRFSYTDALNKYLQTQKRIPVTNLKANVVDFLSGMDVVKVSMGHNPETNKSRINTNVQQTNQGTVNNDHISIATIKEITNLIKTINASPQKATVKPITSTSTTTEQPETEAPESEQTTQNSRCYCMERCARNMIFEGNCGSPNAAGVRKSKCCKSGGSLSSTEEAEEVEY